jgi:hypothetical protein
MYLVACVPVTVTVAPGCVTVFVAALLQDERKAIEPTVAPPTTMPASFKNSRLERPFIGSLFFSSDILFSS